MKLKNTILAFIIFALFLSGCSFRTPITTDTEKKLTPSTAQCQTSCWPQEVGKLTPDPELKFGRLENGLRYVLKKNDVPRDRVALYLLVRTGALNEEEHERGLAHYLEHMEFNGSEHFPPGKLVEYFQKIGMEFGKDLNAQTGYRDTVYKLMLPSGEQSSLDEGMLVLSDYAMHPLLLEEEVDRERGVILAEKLARDSALKRMREVLWDNALKGTLMAKRHIIGLDEIIKGADSKQLLDFFEKWYRPDNMIVLAVGDFDEANMEAAVKKYFTGFEKKGSIPEAPERGSIESDSLRSFYYHEPDAGRTTVAIKSFWNRRPESDSEAYRAKVLREYMASEILGRRFEELEEQRHGLISNSYAANGEIIDTVGYAAVGASTTPESWQEALALIENTLRQFLRYGPTEDEVVRLKKELVSYYEEQVTTAESRQTSSLMDSLIRDLGEGLVTLSPEQERDLNARLLADITPEDLQRAAAGLWGHGDRLIEVAGTVDLKGDAPAQIEQSYKTAAKKDVEAYVESSKAGFPYRKMLKQPVQPAGEKKLESIGVQQFNFDNGVVLSLKQTDFEKGRVRVNIIFGDGRVSEGQIGMSSFAAEVLNGSGTEKRRKIEVDQALAGTSVDFSFAVDTNSFALTGNAVSKEADLLIEVLYNLYAEPGFRKNIFDQKKLEMRKRYMAMQHTVSGLASLYTDRLLTGGDNVYTRALWDELDTVEFADVQKWTLDQFAKKPLEINIVGDFDAAAVVEAVGKTFAGLDKTDFVKSVSHHVTFPAGQSFEKTVSIPLDKAVLVMAWPTDGFASIGEIRRLNMLTSILEEAMREGIREKLGAVYSPSVGLRVERVSKGFGMIQARFVLDPGRLQVVEDEVRKIVTHLVKEGISEEQLEKAREPFLTTLKDEVENNSYWLRVLDNATRYPEQLQWPETIISDNRTISADELIKLARKYLLDTKAATVVVRSK